ncbi:MAG TPA: adenosine kinase [Candidatus Latescibacteria bacterium]|nr:adenosine kinase [Candidatus Latescibacterota bacterium]
MELVTSLGWQIILTPSLSSLPPARMHLASFQLRKDRILSSFDVCGIGHALVDVQFSVTHEKLTELGVDKGVMTLVSAEQRRAVVAGLGVTPVNQASGGSAANTMITVARFGGRAHYAFQAGEDEWGRFYRQDLEAAGVTSNPGAIHRGETGQCLVMVTPDADRTMNTFLGASAAMGPHQVDHTVIEASQFVYLEGYLLTTEDGLAACQAAIVTARRAASAVALTLSDPFVVNAFKPNFDALVEAGVDLLFCNEDEARAFTGLDDRVAASLALAARVARVCVTLGADGALVIDGNGTAQLVPGFPAQAVDTTGAGDTFAGGVLYGLANSLSLEQSAVLGNYGAALVVSAFGPRPSAPLNDLIDDILARRAPLPVAS